MTRDEVQKLREEEEFDIFWMRDIDTDDLKAFADRVAAHERQACIDIINIEHIAKPEIIRAIRARGND